MTGGASVVYRSRDLLVRYVPSGDAARHVITFEHWHIDTGFDRKGFAEDFLRAEGIAATHVLCRTSDWYQYDDVDDALAAARRTVAPGSRVMTYGSSMGAYAAVRFADRVGAAAVLALSPQYSIDPRKMPAENRWGQVQRTLRFLDRVDGRCTANQAPFVVYDPADLDARHADRYAADVPIRRVPIPHAGHPCATLLQEVRVLRPLFFGVLDGTADAAHVTAQVRAVRRRSALYLGNLAIAQPDWRPRTAVALARAATGVRSDALSLLTLAKVLRRQGDHAGAIAAHEASLAHDRDVDMIWNYATTLLAAGRYDDALRHAIEVRERFPDSIDIGLLIARILKAQGKLGQAIATTRALVRRDPKGRGPRRYLRTLRYHAVVRLLGLRR